MLLQLWLVKPISGKLELGLAADELFDDRNHYILGCADMFLRAHRVE
jgi:TetR/AcrR family transcriptional regulator, mexJK operon transcriptional repressor